MNDLELLNEKQAMTLPNLNINVSTSEETKKEVDLVKHKQLTELYGEILDDIRADRKEIDEVFTTYQELAINGGESNSATKELIGTLLRLKSETADKKTKVMELLLRAYLKEQDNGFPRYLNAHQQNTINIDSNSKRNFLKTIIKDENVK